MRTKAQSLERTDRIARLTKLLTYVLLALAGLYVALYLVVAILRLPYPFELEWREGGAVDMVERILAGQPLYGAPALDYVPYTYTPLYFFISAGMARLLGLGFAPLRLVSLLASLGCFVLIFAFVRRESGRALPALLAAGLFAATYRVAGAWLDVARVDSLFLCLLLAALYVARGDDSLPASLLAAVLLCLSFLTKQTALMVAAPVLLALLVARRARAVPFIAASLILVGGSSLALDAAYRGWFRYYAFDLAGTHSIVGNMIGGFWTKDVLILFVAALLSIAYLVRRLRTPDETGLFYLGLLAGGLLASWLSRLSNGGYNNVLLPAYATLAIVGSLGFDAADRFLDTLPARRGTMFRAYLIFLAVIQLATLRYDPAAQVPRAADYRAGQALVERMRQVDGEVFVPSHGYLPRLAGKKSFGSGMALFDMQQPDDPNRARLIAETRAALQARRFGAIVIDRPTSWFADAWFPEMKQDYTSTQRIIDDPAAFWPVTGMRTRPELLYTPRPMPSPSIQE